MICAPPSWAPLSWPPPALSFRASSPALARKGAAADRAPRGFRRRSWPTAQSHGGSRVVQGQA
eukprot:474295-Pyramimonas_sp.AAC.1